MDASSDLKNLEVEFSDTVDFNGGPMVCLWDRTDQAGWLLILAGIDGPWLPIFLSAVYWYIIDERLFNSQSGGNVLAGRCCWKMVLKWYSCSFILLLGVMTI